MKKSTENASKCKYSFAVQNQIEKNLQFHSFTIGSQIALLLLKVNCIYGKIHDTTVETVHFCLFLHLLFSFFGVDPFGSKYCLPAKTAF